ncbi:MAG: helix-turn-helix domain-containing protein [Desulfobacteraceae bacterium]|jgi:DNA-binding MarR family transcriptional regulator|nr:helix-turn-helix domain-containing protein [Desulfobacteraceae bacterium]
MDPVNLLTGIDIIRTRVDNLTLLQAGMLIYILRNPGVTQPELGEYFDTTQATVCRTVNKLAQSGGAGLPWIVLKPDTGDPRRMACFPSEEGRRLLKEVRTLK